MTPPLPPAAASGPSDPDDDRSLLSGYLDGELTAGERAIVDARLAESLEWRAELGEVQAARDAVRALDLRDAPAGFWAGVEAVVASTPDPAPAPTALEAATPGGTVVPLDDHRARRRSRRRIAAWAAGGVAAAVVFGAMFVIPGRHQVRPNVAAVVTRHGATSAQQGDPISGLVPLAPMRSSR
jgi:anti-sigma factor RsiW